MGGEETGPRPAVNLSQRRIAMEQRILRGIDAISARLGRPFTGPAHLATGLRGEEEALFHLRKCGYLIVARRWRTPRLPGDIDLVAWDGDTLCFIEVKTRTGRDLVPAEFAVDEQKQKTLRALAAIFRKRFPEPKRRQIPFRFDVISVYLPGADADLRAAPEIDLFPGAFPRLG
jgi:putative endonuclease